MNLTKLLSVAALLLLGWAWIASGDDGIDAGTAASGPGIETATFSMYCYWTGEATLGRVDGVVASRIGHWQGREVVQVDYDSSKTSAQELARALKRQGSFYALVTSDAAEREEAAAVLGDGEAELLDGKPRFIESKHSLRVAQPRFYALDLTEAQAIALNTWAHFGGPLPDVLTDEQLEQMGLRKP